MSSQNNPLPFQSITQIMQQLTQMFQQEEKPCSGFGCLVFGYQSEFKSDELAIQMYKQGVDTFLDPFCSFRLYQIYSKQIKGFSIEQNNDLAQIYLSISSSYHLYIQQPIEEIDLALEQFELEKLSRNFPLKKLAIAHAKFFQNVLQYDELLNEYEFSFNYSDITSGLIFQLLLIIVAQINTKDKKIQKIISLIHKKEYYQAISDVSLQINQNIFLMSSFKQDNLIFEKQREVLFELVFLVNSIIGMKIDPLKLVSKLIQLGLLQDQMENLVELSELCANIWCNIFESVDNLVNFFDKMNKPIHQALTIRLQTKLKAKGNPYDNINPNLFQALETQKKELSMKKQSQNHYALAYYKIGKLEQKLNQSHKQTFYKAKEQFKARLIVDTDFYSIFLCNYYCSRMSTGELEVEFIEQALSIVENKQLLLLVRTLQYHVKVNKLKKRLKEIQDEQNKLKKKFEEEKKEQLQLLQEQREMMEEMKHQQMLDVQAEDSINPIKSSLTDQIYAPMSISMVALNNLSSSADTAISQYVSKIKMYTKELDFKTTEERRRLLFKEIDGLYYYPYQDIEHIQFMQKSGSGGSMYKIIIQKKLYAMKQIPLVDRKILKQILEQLKEYQQLQHPNLRKSLGLSIEDVDEESINLNFIYDFTNNNLYGFSEQKHITMRERLQIGIDISGALSYLHSQSYYHGNIKPTNVLTTMIGGQVGQQFQQFFKKIFGFLGDWEFVQRIFGIMDQKTWGLLEGYTAQEVMENSENVCFESDIWSMGMILMYCLFNLDIRMKKIDFKQSLIKQGNLKETDENRQIEQLIKSMLKADPYERKTMDIVVKELVLLQVI